MHINDKHLTIPFHSVILKHNIHIIKLDRKAFNIQYIYIYIYYVLFMPPVA